MPLLVPEWPEDSVAQRNDFSIREEPVVVEKEVVRVPCTGGPSGQQ
ncbi:MAG TPA: hypothetical protein VEC08_02465 [Nitrososphaerales archaeon]|nr:hypothetical protein [Nitrososphaerales archaeon]